MSFRFLLAAFAAFFYAGIASAQNSGTVTNHAFALGKGPGVQGYTSLLCGSAQLAVGQAAADPICRTLTGDVTLSAAGVTTLGNIPNGTTMAGSILATAIAAPSTPAAGKDSIWVDSTDKRLHDKNDAGVIGTTSVALTCSSSNWFRTMSSAGVYGCSQPAFSDLSGSIACSQMPAHTGDVTSSAGSCALTIANNAVTYAKFQQVTAARLLGNPTGALANASEISLGATLAFSGSALQTGAMTGDVTASANSFATTIAANAVTNAKMATMAANTVKANATGSAATPTDVTAQTARSNALLNIDQATGTGDANYTILATDRTVYHTALSAARTDTLPAANAVNPGQILWINDPRGVASATFTVTLQRAGADTINGGTTFVALQAANGVAQCISDGSSRWACAQLGGTGGGGGVSNVTPGNGLVSSLTAACSQSAITSSGTLSAAECVNAQTGTSYAILDTDRAKLITASNAAAQAYTIAQAGAASAFQAGWFTDVANVGTNVAGIVTITPTTSTIDGAATLTLRPGQRARIVSDGTNYTTASYSNPSSLPVVLRSYIAGLTLSTAGSSTTFSVAVGVAADSTNVDLMTLASSISKTTSAWAVGSGNGGLDTGSIAANTWYHAWLIKRPDTRVVDVLVSLSASSPTLPTNYTIGRRIGAMRTNGSSQWTAFQQLGDKFEWLTGVVDVNAVTPTSGATNTVTLTVSPGVQVEAIISAQPGFAGGGATQLWVWPTFMNIPTISNGGTMFTAGNVNPRQMVVTTNTSAQVSTRLSYGSSTTYSIETLGWYDTRGRLN